MSVLHLNGESFHQLIEVSDVPVLVDFWADWCGPCKMLAPILETVEKTLGGKCVIAKVNVDEESEVAATFGIMSIPTMVLFRGGKEVDRMTGLVDEDTILDFVK